MAPYQCIHFVWTFHLQCSGEWNKWQLHVQLSVSLCAVGNVTIPHVISSAMCRGARMLPNMQILYFFWTMFGLPPPLYLFIFVHAICHVAFSLIWRPHVLLTEARNKPPCPLPCRLTWLLFRSTLPRFPRVVLCIYYLWTHAKLILSEANGTGTLPRFTVNNAFATKSQSFKGIDGL